MRSRLWARIVVLFLVLLLAVQAATFLVIRASIERNARAAIAEELAVGERVLRRLLAQNVQRLGDSAGVLAVDFGFRAVVASGDRETLSSALANHGGRIGASMAVMLDTACSTIDLAHGLGLKVVAEGIETEAAWAMLREMGCEQGQGYLIGRPTPASAFAEWAASWEGSPRSLPVVTVPRNLVAPAPMGARVSA